MAAKPTSYNIRLDKAAIEVLFDQTSCLRQAQVAPEEVQRRNAVGKGSITNLEHKAEDATVVFADVSRFSRPTVVPYGQKSMWEKVV